MAALAVRRRKQLAVRHVARLEGEEAPT
jgi:hypothetical protein